MKPTTTSGSQRQRPSAKAGGGVYETVGRGSHGITIGGAGYLGGTSAQQQKISPYTLVFAFAALLCCSVYLLTAGLMHRRELLASASVGGAVASAKARIDTGVALGAPPRQQQQQQQQVQKKDQQSDNEDEAYGLTCDVVGDMDMEMQGNVVAGGWKQSAASAKACADMCRAHEPKL